MIGMESFVGSAVSALPTPCCVIDRSIVEANCRAMAERAIRLGCVLRPHTKTHKTLEIARMQTRGSARCVVVSTLAEAEFYANGGFDDILLASLITPSKLPRCAALHNRLSQFHVYVDSSSAVEALRAHAHLLRPHHRAVPSVAASSPSGGEEVHGGAAEGEPASCVWSVFLAVDCGYNREGCGHDDPQSLQLALDIAAGPHTTLAGVYSHSGHTYQCRDPEAIRRVGEEERDRLAEFAKSLAARGVVVPCVGVGSTPSCCVPPDHLDGITEMHPGNYCLLDYMQTQIGSGSLRDVAVFVLARIISHNPARRTVLVDAGALALSKDLGCSSSPPSYGYVVDHPSWTIVGLTQEAGKIALGEDDRTPVTVGQTVRIVPNHSCLTCACHDYFFVVDGSDVVTAVWRPVRGW
eukprot:gnl/Spiro4/18448_TR9873_c0_g1_i1.p1 gnl/Spiro4/18448_TR9873_c0_g1~~gnl/Spiro4/18448_TR9873_c0_g1_i1.p1  ORF type:complete len:409 (+),score=75.99 gnl/Spiro4/18448_TR9873_c0_g1_i1:37-1263(+)